MKLSQRLGAFTDTSAWFLVILGLVLFASRHPFSAGGFVNLPVAVTVLQTAGLMFMIAGFQIFISRVVWPGVNFGELIEHVRDPEVNGNASALVLLGLFVYNGVTTVAFVLWLSSAMGAGLGG